MMKALSVCKNKLSNFGKKLTLNQFDKYKYKKQYKSLLIAAFLFYIATVAIKLIYSTQLSALEEYYGKTKAEISLGLTIYYFSYAFFQIVLSFFISKINVKKFLVVTSLISALSFAGIALTTDLWQVWIIFGLNGFFQCAGWGGLIYILTKHLPNDTLPATNKLLTIGLPIGNSLAYLISGICVEYFNWKVTFIIFAVFYIFSIIYFFVQESMVEKTLKNGDEYVFEVKDHSHDYVIPAGKKFNVVSFMIIITTLCFLAQSLSYGFGNWVPTLLFELDFPLSKAITISLVMPLVTIPPSFMMFNLFEKTGRVYKWVSMFGIITLLLLGVMIFGYNLNLVFAIIMCIALKFTITCLNCGSTSYVTMKLKNYINSGTSALILNSFASVGAGIMPFISGALMDKFGWIAHFISMFILCLLALTFVIILQIKIKKNKDLSKWL